MNTSKAIKLQCAADLVGDLADAVADMGKQLDDLHSEIGEELYSRVRQAFPLEVEFGPKANAALIRLANGMTPPDRED